MIKVSNLKKSYKKTTVLKNISFEVEEGEVVAIIGPSGSGKSTLLRCLNFLEQPDSGRIQIGEADVDAAKAGRSEVNHLRKQTSMVFQHYNLFKNKTALENITYPLMTVKKVKKNEANEIGRELLEQVGLKDKAENYPVALSGGQQQRVGIARALAVNPHAILLDEPTSSLDPEWVGEVLRVISGIANKHKTMIIVTHEMGFAREVADKVIFMADGVIVEQGKPENVLDNPQHERTKRFLQDYLKQSSGALHIQGEEGSEEELVKSDRLIM